MNKTFSANMLKAFQECPYKYNLEYEKNLKIPQDYSIAQKGKNLHALINYYFKGFNITTLEQSLSEEEKELWQNFLTLNIDRNDIYESEYTFNIKLKEKTWLTGRIDAIIKKDDNYIIYDWKTGSLPKNPENDLQTIIYLYALDKLLEKKGLKNQNTILSFIYFNLKKQKEKIIKTTKDLLKSYQGEIEEVTRDIDFFSSARIYKKTTTRDIKTHCENCNYNKTCEKGLFLLQNVL